MKTFCQFCGVVDTCRHCPECGRTMEDYDTGKKLTQKALNLDDFLNKMESKEEFRKMFGEYFHIRGK